MESETTVLCVSGHTELVGMNAEVRKANHQMVLKYIKNEFRLAKMRVEALLDLLQYHERLGKELNK
jgi:hypothetical protein